MPKAKKDENFLKLIRSFINLVLFADSREETLLFLYEHDRDMYDTLVKLYDSIDDIRDWEIEPTPKRTNTFDLAFRKPSQPKLSISSETLCTHIVPLINALIELQRIINQLKGLKTRELPIRYIRQDAEVEVSVDGIADALKLFNTLIIPWRIGYTQKLDALHDLETRLEAERQIQRDLGNKIKTGEFTNKIKATEDSINDLLLQIERCKRKLEKLLLSITESIVNASLAEPNNVTPRDKMLFCVRLLEPIKVIADSPLQLMNIKIEEPVVVIL